jgi:hypothetical protein
MATKKGIGNGIAVLAFIGSLLYLYVLFSWVSAGTYGLAAWAGAVLWLPLLAAMAAVGSIGLFIMSLMAIAGVGEKKASWMMGKSALWAGFALFALTAGGMYFWWVVVGFFLAAIGSREM